MATLQKFKLLTAPCGLTQSPTRSPRTSPVVHFRHRKNTLRMLLSRSTSRRSPRLQDMPYQQITPTSLPKVIKKDSTQRNSLKDLFVSSPPPMEEGPDEMDKKIVRGQTAGSVGNVSPDGSVYSRDGPASPRPVWLGFRCRSLLRRAWRPVLVSISE